MQKPESKRDRFQVLKAQLSNERSSFMTHWRELGENILPRRPRFTISDVNKGDRRNSKIFDNTPTLAARTLRSGMMGGITSPARPWFRLTTPDPELAEVPKVKNWLHTVDQRMVTVFLRSNLYNSLPIVFGDLGVFATAAMLVEEDMETVIRTYAFPIGSYMIGTNEQGKVDIFIREFRMTVRQLVQRFAVRGPGNKIIWDNFSDTVQSLYERGQLETWIDITHVISPNEDYDPKKLESKHKKYCSCYYENGSGTHQSGNYLRGDKDRFLRESGYDSFPVLVPRWEVTGEDVYGTDCPGMAALGDIKQLQLGEKRSAQAIEKMVNPPMTGPVGLKNTRVSILPGDITYADEREGTKGLRPVHEVNPRINELEQKQQQIRQRIQRAFYEDLFLMMANSDRREITATEIDERKEEKLLALGPVLEQLNQDLLDPLIDNTFEIMMRQGLIPEPPEELHGVPLKVEYISVMAQAQKLIGIGSVERFTQFVGNLASYHPEALDKVDFDQTIEIYGDMTSVPPKVIVPTEDAQAARKGRAQAQQAQAQAQQMRDVTESAKSLSQADMSGENALTALMDQANAGSLVPQG